VTSAHTSKPIPGSDLTVTAGVDLAKGRFVMYRSNKWQYPSANGLAVGVMPLRRECESGSDIALDTAGIALVIAGSGGVSEAAEVASDASGQAVAAAGAGTYVLGIALNTATEGQYAQILLKTYKLIA
jgi:hypothetical protein